MKKIEMINKQFGKFLVIEQDYSKKSKNLYYIVECQECKTRFSSMGGHIRKLAIKCPKCIRKNYKDISGQRFGLLTAIKPTEDRYNGSIVWFCKCDCGGSKNVPVQALLGGGTQSCGCLRTSVGELNIERILKENNINYIKQFNFDFDKRKKYDFAILNNNNQIIRLIEFDGKQHFNKDGELWFKSDSFEIRQSRDKIKNNYAKENNIPLVRIPYWERNNITLDIILGGKYEI